MEQCFGCVLGQFINFQIFSKYFIIIFLLSSIVRMSYSKPELIVYHIEDILNAENELSSRVKSDTKVQSKQTKSIFKFIFLKQKN
jgi:hypothetical protein